MHNKYARKGAYRESSKYDAFEIKESNAAYYAAMKVADFILRNQWISVKDKKSLLEDIPNCFVAYKAMDMMLYSTGSYEKDKDEWYVDGFGYNAEVTHWMPIPPQLEGEE
jgi:hypothetical protein